MITISKIEVMKGGNAIYELPLKQTIYDTKRIDFEKNLSIKKDLESITDFERRLEYYNRNVSSLSIYSMAGNIYFEWGNPDQRIKIYCGCKSCRKTPDFSIEQEQIYFKLRNNEVKRITKIVTAAESYEDKLDAFFSIKGYHPDAPPALYSNIPFDPATDPDTALFYSAPLVDLKPQTKEQIIAYNHFVKLEFERVYKDQFGFSKNYKCFDSEKEIERLNLTLGASIDPHNLLLYCRSRINNHFNYPECLKQSQDSEPVKNLNEQINKISLGSLLFPKMVLGSEIDLNRIILDESELLRYTHISEIVKFYKYLEEKIKERYSGSIEIRIQPWKKMLSELTNENPEFEKLMKLYDSKISTATEFMSKVDFINAEIDRIENDFMNPIPSHFTGDFRVTASFSLEKYSRLAFESLRCGIDREIKSLLNMAKKEYIQFSQINIPSFSELTNAEEIAKVENSAFFMLQQGVAFLKYQQFLKIQKDVPKLPGIECNNISKGFKVKQVALIHAYEGTQITRLNAGEIAAKFGYTSKNSGEGLFQDYTAYSSSTFRKSKPTPCTPKKLKNKIELFESIVEHLTDRAKSRAEDEIKILKTLFENEYQ